MSLICWDMEVHLYFLWLFILFNNYWKLCQAARQILRYRYAQILLSLKSLCTKYSFKTQNIVSLFLCQSICTGLQFSELTCLHRPAAGKPCLAMLLPRSSIERIMSLHWKSMSSIFYVLKPQVSPWARLFCAPVWAVYLLTRLSLWQLFAYYLPDRMCIPWVTGKVVFSFVSQEPGMVSRTG